MEVNGESETETFYRSFLLRFEIILSKEAA